MSRRDVSPARVIPRPIETISTYPQTVDELIRAERTARRGLAFAILVVAVLFGSMLIAWEVYVYFFMDLSGLG
jgi:hypothetical protein